MVRGYTPQPRVLHTSLRGRPDASPRQRSTPHVDAGAAQAELQAHERPVKPVAEECNGTFPCSLLKRLVRLRPSVFAHL